MTTENFITKLRKDHKITITVDQGELKVRGQKTDLTNEILMEIKEKKSEILDFFNMLTEQQQVNRIPVAIKRDFYPLSSSQKRLYFMYELDRNSLAYNITRAIRISGALDTQQLEKAFKTLIQRHGSLRTTFKVIEGSLFQQISELKEFRITDIQSSGNTDQDIEQFVRPFNLEKENAIRIGMIRVNEQEHVLVLDMHHIVSDGASQNIMIGEFVALYNNHEQVPLPIQFIDFVEWQLSDEQQKRNAKQKQFWISQFSDGIEALQLPTDFVRSVLKRHNGETIRFTINTTDTAQLRAIADTTGTTMFMVLLSAYYTLLHKLTSQQDIVIGTPVSGRSHDDLANVIGMFVNTLPLRIQSNDEQSFSTLLFSLKELTVSCFDNQLFPYEELINTLDIERDTSRNPLFDVMFTYESAEEDSLRIPDLTLTPINNNLSTSKFDLTLKAYEGKEDFSFDFEYSSELFRKETIERFAIYFQKVISVIVKDVHVGLSSIEIITEKEKQDILWDFNNTVQDFSGVSDVISLFEARVVKTPENKALQFDGFTLSYSETESLSNKIAGYLKSLRGLKKGDIVGILLEREIYLIPSIYGIMKAGCAYVPIDPHYPKARIDSILSDSGLKTIITRSRFKDKLSKNVLEIVDLDLAWGEIKEASEERLDISILPSDLAYVIYTSGSSGKPKGVMVEHHSLLNIIRHLQQEYALREGDCYLLKTTYSFDVSCAEIFGWFLEGGSIAILPPGEEMDPVKILNAIQRHGVTHINFVPTMFAALVDEMERTGIERVTRLKYIFLAGEALPVDLVERFNKLQTAIALLNIYGPTEGTIYSSAYDLKRLPAGSRTVPIGKPLSNIQLYVLNGHKQVQPRGVSGELYIGGAAVARGYLGNATLTDEKFLPDPYVKGRRVYRTGDLARLSSNGEIEYMGRIDSQVKFKGFRIELSEIEGQLTSYEGVHEAVVVIMEKEGVKLLVAYYVSSKSFVNDELRRHLSASLPTYMVPQHIICLAKLPLTSNGKIDRKALPDPVVGRNTETYLTSSVTENEKLLTDIWLKVLGISEVGVDDNFFSLGGDSIKSIQIAYRVRNLGWELSVQDIFIHQTIRQLANQLKRTTLESSQSIIEGTASLTPIQNWFFDLPIRNKQHFNQSVLLNFEKGISLEAVRAIFNKIQTHHDALRIVFREEQPGIIQKNEGYQFPLIIEELDLRNEGNPSPILLARINKLQASLDINNGPLMKVGLFHLHDGSRLQIIIHHLVVDGISWRILFEDIDTLYQQLQRGDDLVLPLKSEAFIHWPVYLARYAQSAVFYEAANYWDRVLQKPFNAIPENAHSQATRREAKRISFHLNREHTSRLVSDVHRPFNTRVIDILLTTLFLSLEKSYHINSVKIDLESHGREQILSGINISRTIGWFTSIYPVVLEKNGTTIKDTIKGIKEMLRQIPNNGMDYLLKKYMNGDSRASHSERSQICFNYLGQFDSDIQSRSFSISNDSSGDEISLDETLIYDWDLSCLIKDGCFKMTLLYNPARFNEVAVTEWLAAYNNMLVEVMQYCTSYPKTERTLSDFTWKDGSPELLEKWQEQYLIKDVYPLSPMQEGILFHSMMEGGEGSYLGQTSCEVIGDLDVGAVKQSMEILTQRYDIFRTVFLHEGLVRPVQLVLESCSVNCNFIDVRSEYGTKSREEVTQRYLLNERINSFDLSKDSLMRMLILYTGEQRYELIWSYHHALLDGWCMSIIIDEFKQIYSALVAGRNINLPSVYPYSAYIKWLSSRSRTLSETYWREYLKNYTGLASFPKSQSFLESNHDQCELKILLDPKLVQRIQDVSREYGLTMNTVFQGAWGMVLSRYNNTNDVVFGAVVSGRPAELEGVGSMIGLFINTVPVRINCDTKQRVGDFLHTIQSRAMESEPHHYHPLYEIQQLSSLGQNLLDHILVYQNFPEEDSSNGTKSSFETSNVKHFVQTNYDLSLTIKQSASVELQFDYNANAYSLKTISQIASQLKAILLSLTQHIDEPILELDFPNELVQGQSGAATNLESGFDPKPIQLMLNSSFEKHSNLIAIEYLGIAYTYSDIDAKVRRITSRLISDGVLERGFVGILVKDRINFICAVLASLKARLAFVPLEVSLPLSRLVSMVDQVEIHYVITDQNPEDYSALGADIKWLSLNDESVWKNESANDSITLGYDLEDPVYVYFTSGSTGKPKGVKGRNKGLAHFIQWELVTFQLNCQFRISQFTNPGFDVFMRDVFVPLCAGAALCIPSEEDLSTGKGISNWIHEQRITLIHCVPSFFKLFTKENLSGKLFPELKYILLAGEKILPFELKHWYTTVGNRIQLVNVYGPTETTLAKGFYLINSNDCEKHYIPIKAMSGAQFLILDNDLNLCPQNALGEIFIRTPFRSLGYLDPLQTEKVFIESPIEGHNKEILYKTGDLARENERGEIEIVGRADHQVKIRGIRIELDDIKENILRFPGISEAVVVVLEDAQEEKLITAYFSSPSKCDPTSLRNYLNDVLPQNMIPSYLIQLPAMPLLPNGKIDKKSLPPPLITSDENEIFYANEDERLLAEIWADVLKVDQKVITTTKTFFELGGHSVRVFHLINKIHEKFSVKLKLGDIFKNNSIKKLALLLSDQVVETSVQIPKVGERRFYETSPAQKRMFYQYLRDKQGVKYNVPFAVRVLERVDPIQIKQVFLSLIERHESLRTKFKLTDDGVVQEVVTAFNFEIEILSQVSEGTIKEAYDDFVRPFDLSSAPLIRCGLYHGNTQTYLFVDAHHIVADGLSLNVLIRDLKNIFLGQRLEPISITYKDYASWINSLHGNLKNHELFWREKLAGDLPRLNLPRMYELTKVDIYPATRKILVLDVDRSKTVKQFASDHNVSDFIFLISIYYLLLSRATDCDDVIIGTDVVGRSQPALQNVVGTFVNVLPLRMQINPGDSFDQFLGQVKERVVEAFEHQDFPFDKMISLVNDADDSPANPIFDVHFAYLNTAENEVRLDTFDHVHIESKRDAVTNYEFKLEVWEAKGKMELSFIYASDIYDDDTMNLLVRYYSYILKAVLKNDQIEINNIKIEGEELIDQYPSESSQNQEAR